MNKKDLEDKKKYDQATKDLVESHGVFKVKKTVMSLNKFRKIYNNLCSTCKKKVLKNPKMSFLDYCGDCQRVIDKVRL